MKNRTYRSSNPGCAGTYSVNTSNAYDSIADANHVHSCEFRNNTGGDLYLFVFDVNTAPANGDRPQYAIVKVPTDTTGYKDFGSAGGPIKNDLCYVAVSTTDDTLTLYTSSTIRITTTYS